MKLYVLPIFLLVSIKVFSQTNTVDEATPKAKIAKTKKVVNEDHFAMVRETYHVLASDNNTLEGEYEVVSLSKRTVRQHGYFHNDKKDSIWKDYHPNGNLLLEGAYKEGDKRGIWNAYNSRNQLQVQYNYSTKQLLFFKPAPDDSTRLYDVIRGADTIRTTLERCPVYLNGNAWWHLAIGRNTVYPSSAREASMQGEVVVDFIIDANGKAHNYHVKKRLGMGLDEAAIKAIVLSGGEWLPGVLNGQPVSVKYSIPIKFNVPPTRTLPTETIVIYR